MPEPSPASRRLKALGSAARYEPGGAVASQAVSSIGKLPLIAAMLGVMVGLLGIAFFEASSFLELSLLTRWGGIPHAHSANAETDLLAHTRESLLPEASGHIRLWMLVLVPVGGSILLVLWTLLSRDRQPSHFGTIIDAFHNRRGRFDRGTFWKKFVASTISVGTGASGGREGPIGVIGASLGSSLAERFHLTYRERNILLAAGLAAGIGGMFRAPLAGALLAAEVFYSDSEFEPDVLVPSIIASVTSYCTMGLVYGFETLFDVVAAGYRFENPLDLVAFTLLSLVMVATVWLQCRTSKIADAFFARFPALVRPIIGMGLAAGLTLVAVLVFDGHNEFFSLMGDGYISLQTALKGDVSDLRFTWWMMIVFALAKLFTAVASVNSGNAAGTFASTVVIGAAIGAAVGGVIVDFFPTVLHPGHTPAEIISTCALVGMAGNYAGVAKAPIATVVMVSELTGSYHLLIPALWVCTMVFLLSRSFRKYSSQVASRKESPAHIGDFHVNILEEIKVRDIIDELKEFETVGESTSLQEILSARTSRQSYYPVINKVGDFVGIFSFNDLRAVIDQQDVWNILVAADIAQTDIKTVHLDETLAGVAAKFAETHLDELPVVRSASERRLEGIISRRQLNNAYIRRVLDYDKAVRLDRTRIYRTDSLVQGSDGRRLW